VQIVEDQKSEKAGTESERGQEPAGRGAGRDEQDERQQPRESERPGLEGERQPREHGPDVVEVEREESAVAAESRAEAEVVLEEKPRRERGGRRKSQTGRPAEQGGPPLEDVVRGGAEDDQDRAHRSLDFGQNGAGEHPRRQKPARSRVLGQERRDGDGFEKEQRRLGVGARERGRHGGRHGRDPERGHGRRRVAVEPAPQKAPEQRRRGRDPEERGQRHGAPGELPGRNGAERLDDRDERRIVDHGVHEEGPPQKPNVDTADVGEACRLDAPEEEVVDGSRRSADESPAEQGERHSARADERPTRGASGRHRRHRDGGPPPPPEAGGEADRERDCRERRNAPADARGRQEHAGERQQHRSEPHRRRGSGRQARVAQRRVKRRAAAENRERQRGQQERARVHRGLFLS